MQRSVTITGCTCYESAGSRHSKATEAKVKTPGWLDPWLAAWLRCFDAALAILTIHHWQNRQDGLAEMRRVARERIVIFTWDPEHPGFWLVQDYFPEILETDRPIFPSLREIKQAIGPAKTQVVPVPAD
jgi:SAM-dependent methyltransferase